MRFTIPLRMLDSRGFSNCTARPISPARNPMLFARLKGLSLGVIDANGLAQASDIKDVRNMKDA